MHSMLISFFKHFYTTLFYNDNIFYIRYSRSAKIQLIKNNFLNRLIKRLILRAYHQATGCFFNSVFYDLALIQSFFGIFEIWRTFFHSIHRRIFKNAKTLLIVQILVWKIFPQRWPFFSHCLVFDVIFLLIIISRYLVIVMIHIRFVY
jgi:hypothetical protein